MVNNGKVNAIIKAKTADIAEKADIRIKTRLERQQWWSNMMTDAKTDGDKLRASEDLARSEGDFTDNLTIDVDKQCEIEAGVLKEAKRISHIVLQSKLLPEKQYEAAKQSGDGGVSAGTPPGP